MSKLLSLMSVYEQYVNVRRDVQVNNCKSVLIMYSVVLHCFLIQRRYNDVLIAILYEFLETNPLDDSSILLYENVHPYPHTHILNVLPPPREKHSMKQSVSHAF